jgi:hypothetical protein
MKRRLDWRIPMAALVLLSGSACMVRHPNLASREPLPEPKDGESDLDEQRRAWIESRHRAAPGTDWHQVERENRQRNAARLAAEAATQAPANGVTWQERSINNVTGRTWAAAIAGDGNTLLIGSGDEAGGVFSGTPGGSGWTQRANLIGLGVQQLIVAPGSPETWTAISSHGYNSEVFVSADLGVTWATPNGLPGGGFIVARALREPGVSRTLYLLLLHSGMTIYRSDDGGRNYAPFFNTSVTAIPDMWLDRIKPGPLYLLTDSGLKSSSDHGASFTPVGNTIFGGTYLRLAGSEAGAPSFYAVVSGSNKPTSVLLASADGGHTWYPRGSLPDFFNSITASISKPGILLLGGVNVYRSTDAGVTLTAINDWSEYYGDPAHKLHADLRGLECAIYQGIETFFIDTDGGTFMSTDLGATVENVTQLGMDNAEYYSTLTSKNDPNLIAAGSQDQGLQQSTSAAAVGLSFNQLISGDYGHLSSTNGDQNILYAVYPGFVAVLDHETGNQNIDQVSFPAANNRDWMPFVLADPADASAFYLTGDPLFRIFHGASGWTPTPFAQDFSAGHGDYLSALAISRVDQHYWYAASSQGRLWYSHDNGMTWTESASQGPGAHYFYGSSLLASTTTPTTCYVGGAGYSGPAAYKTTDGGVTWKEMGDGLPSTLVQGLAFDDPVKQNLYAATDAGPFVFNAATSKWQSLVSGNAPPNGYWAVEGVPAQAAVRFATYGRGIWDYSPTGGPCVATAQSMCLGQNRFQIVATWATANATGTAQVVQLTPDTGYLYFFDPSNVEAVIKIVDGCALNKQFWVFAGGLTNVLTQISVRDSLTGTIKTYSNPQGKPFQPIQDTSAFATCSTVRSESDSGPAAAAATAAAGDAREPGFTAGSREPGLVAETISGTSLLLNNNRFKVDVIWQTPDGKSGTGTPVAVTGDTGYFWFFSSSNVEMVIKVLSGCGLNSKYWVFAGGLTNVLTTIQVTDTQTGTAKTYTNPQGTTFQPIQDTSAFSACP